MSWSRDYPERDGYYLAADPKVMTPMVIMVDDGRLHVKPQIGGNFELLCAKESLDFDLVFSGPIQMPKPDDFL